MSTRIWPRQATATIVGILLPLAVEVWFLGRYSSKAATWHWYVHLFAGATLALTLMTRWSWRRRRPVPFPLIWVLLAHFYSAAPDLVIPENIPHKPWQDVLVAHLASHYLPGRGIGWLALFAAALAGYLASVDRSQRLPRVRPLTPDPPQNVGFRPGIESPT